MRIKWRRRILTPEEEKELIKDYNAMMPIKEMEEKHKVSKATIYNVLKRSAK